MVRERTEKDYPNPLVHRPPLCTGPLVASNSKSAIRWGRVSDVILAIVVTLRNRSRIPVHSASNTNPATPRHIRILGKPPRTAGSTLPRVPAARPTAAARGPCCRGSFGPVLGSQLRGGWLGGGWGTPPPGAWDGSAAGGPTHTRCRGPGAACRTLRSTAAAGSSGCSACWRPPGPCAPLATPARRRWTGSAGGRPQGRRPARAAPPNAAAGTPCGRTASRRGSCRRNRGCARCPRTWTECTADP
mmetsp:Transcript_17950/g.31234  ORF Transcript_17950/g.31234 Transcript_17950/m.31234 type:complete len:245 (-) Transcript_17950:154-888(-)